MSWFGLALVVMLPGGIVAQDAPVPLSVVAEETRASWRNQDATGLVARSPQLVIQLPSAPAAAWLASVATRMPAMMGCGRR